MGKIINYRKFTDNEFGYLCGLIFGDAHISKRAIILTTSKEENAKAIIKKYKDFNPRFLHYVRKSNAPYSKDKNKLRDVFVVAFNSIQLIKRLKNVKIFNKRQKEIPNFLFKNRFFGSFLSGIIDSEGNFNIYITFKNQKYKQTNRNIRFYSANADLLNMISTELKQRGIKASIYTKKYRDNTPSISITNKASINSCLKLLTDITYPSKRQRLLKLKEQVKYD